MKFIELLKRIIKLNNKVQINTNLANITDVVTLPTRDDYQDNQEIINLIDKYKVLYKEKLYKKVLTSHDLQIDDLVSEMNMNIDLILNVVLTCNDNNQLEKIIKYFKLKLYLDEINELDIKNKAKLIAILELSNDIRYLFSKHKRDAIFNEINNLSSNMIVFMSQKKSIELETNSYLLNVEIPDFINEDFRDIKDNMQYDYIRYTIYKSENENYYNEHLEQVKQDMNFIKNTLNYLSKLKDTIKKIFPEILNKINSKESSTIKKIVLLERVLEIYVYQNKDKVQKFNNDINLLKDITITNDNQIELLHKIEKIENMLKIFKDYGRNLVKEENWYNLYELKFAVMTYEINNKEINKTLYGITLSSKIKENAFAYEYYKKVVSNKLTSIMNGSNEIASKFQKNNLLGELIHILEKEFKTGKYYDFEKILQERYLLCLILAFDNEEKFYNFYNLPHGTFMEELYKILERSRARTFQKDFEYSCYFSLRTLCFIIELNQKDNNKKLILPTVYKLYELWNKVNPSKIVNNDCYEIPEGISEIKDVNGIYTKIKSEMNGKRIIIPSTMKNVPMDAFKYLNIKGLILKEGVEEIDMKLLKSKLEYLTIPASLSTGNLNDLNLEKLKYLEFTNYTFNHMLLIMLYGDYDDEDNLLPKLISNYEKGRILYHMDLELKSELETITLSDSYGHLFEIELRDLIIWSDENRYKMNKSNLKMFQSKLKELIGEKTKIKLK